MIIHIPIIVWLSLVEFTRSLLYQSAGSRLPLSPGHFIFHYNYAQLNYPLQFWSGASLCWPLSPVRRKSFRVRPPPASLFLCLGSFLSSSLILCIIDLTSLCMTGLESQQTLLSGRYMIQPSTLRGAHRAAGKGQPLEAHEEHFNWFGFVLETLTRWNAHKVFWAIS